MFGPGNLAVGNSVLHEFVKERGRSKIIIIFFRSTWQEGGIASDGLNFGQPNRGISIDGYTKLIFV